MSVQQFINQINPRKLFLVDSIGALLSAIMLGLILARFETVFGMPPQVLYFLSFLAGIFFIYSLLCFLGKIESWRLYMKIIAIVNLLYCCLTIGVIIFFYQKLGVLGLLYFAGEIILVTILAVIELKTASNLVYKSGSSSLPYA